MTELTKRMGKINKILNTFNIIFDLFKTCKLDSHGYVNLTSFRYYLYNKFKDEASHKVKFLTYNFNTFFKFVNIFNRFFKNVKN